MKLLDPKHTPTTADLIEILEPAMDSLARTLTDDHHLLWRSVRETFGLDLVILTVNWTWHSQTCGALPMGATIIQVTRGGLDQVTAFGHTASEGWAVGEQYVIDRHAATDELEAAVLLIATDSLPRRVAWKEL